MQILEHINVRQWRCNAAELRDSELVEKLTDYICTEFSVPSPRRSDLQLVLSEVFVNSIDHGLLELDSQLKKDPEGFEKYFQLRSSRLAKLTKGSILVRVEHHDNALIRITVHDSGNGFEYSQQPIILEPEALMASYGRGLLIIQQLCESMKHTGNGNCIVVDFNTVDQLHSRPL